MPSFMLLDDHEIEDNWEPIAPPSPDNSDLRDAGVAAYRKYQRGMNAPPSPPGQSDSFLIEGVPLFILDTRSTRERRTAANLDAARLFDAQTLNDLGNWLAGAPSVPKFVVSPAMLLPRHRRATQWNEVAAAVRSDGWDGYPATLHAVLSRIVDDGNVQHVVFLSGDEHCASVATIDITNVDNGATKRIHSIHTCGTFTPFPFANGSPSELMGSETFDFQHGGSAYRCVVSTAFAATRNRFTYLNLRQDGADWLLEHQFGDGPLGTLVV
jgi:phosphodiesterase/alkaline phosphatase D-like protein